MMAFWLAAALIAAVGSAKAQDIREAEVVLPVPAQARVVVHRDIVYRIDDSDTLRLDIYVPAAREAGDQSPVVFFVHGGPVPTAWTGGAKAMGQYRSLGRLMAASGVAAVAFNHRFRDAAAASIAATDVNAALEWVRAHGRDHGLDAERVCIWAVSGGGMFIAPWLRRPPPYLRCFVLYYAALVPSGMERLLPGFPPAFATEYDAVAAIEAAGRAAPPLLMARAGQDFEVINEGMDAFLVGALRAGVAVEMLNHPAGEHAFDVLNDDDRSRAIVSRSIAFVAHALAAND